MRLTEIGDKEIVDLANGSMHGKLWDAEILFEESTGMIHALLVPEGRRSYLKEDLQLPWKSIIIVGEDTIIFQSC